MNRATERDIADAYDRPLGPDCVKLVRYIRSLPPGKEFTSSEALRGARLNPNTGSTMTSVWRRGYARTVGRNEDGSYRYVSADPRVSLEEVIAEHRRRRGLPETAEHVMAEAVRAFLAAAEDHLLSCPIEDLSDARDAVKFARAAAVRWT